MIFPTAENNSKLTKLCILALAFSTFLLAGCGEDWKWGSWYTDDPDTAVTGVPVADDALVTSPWGLAGFGTHLYVTENARHRLLKISILESDGINTLIWEAGGLGSEAGELLSPEGVAVDGAGNVYVADRGNGRIQKFSSGGVFLAQWGDTEPPLEDGDLIDPTGIAIDGDGFIYVSDSDALAVADTYRVVKFTSAGVYDSHWGTAGTGDGELAQPAGLAVDTVEGELYVVDGGNHRVQVFTLGGVYLRQFGAEGTENGQFTTPWGITVDQNDGVYVTDRTADSIQLFDYDGTFIRALNVSPDDDALDTPTGITTLEGRVWICETTPNRVRGF